MLTVKNTNQHKDSCLIIIKHHTMTGTMHEPYFVMIENFYLKDIVSKPATKIFMFIKALNLINYVVCNALLS
jgi:hypothetical protein